MTPTQPTTEASASTASRFDELVARLRREAAPSLSLESISRSPAFREVVGWGGPAVPLILTELESDPDHAGLWDVMLQALTGDDPVPPEARGDLQATADAWLAWGRQEEADRAEALRITPGSERLRAMIVRGSSSTIDYSQEANELPC